MIKIVKAEEKHIAEIGKLWWEFMEFNQKVDPIFTPKSSGVSDFLNQVARFMKSENGLALVAIDGTKVVGFSLSGIRKPSPVYERGEYGILDTMAVTASYRRMGIGEKMVTEIMKWFKSKGINRVELETAAQNLVANSFWQKNGFTIYRHRLYREIK